MEEVRAASVADLDALERLASSARAELATERGGPMWRVLHGRPDPLGATLVADLTEAAEGAATVLLGTVAGAPGGYAVAHLDHAGDSRMVVVTDIYVEPGFRDIGLGAALMDEVLRWASGHGCASVDAIVLPGMRQSKNFFERYGLTARAILVHRDLEARPVDDGDSPQP